MTWNQKYIKADTEDRNNIKYITEDLILNRKNIKYVTKVLILNRKSTKSDNIRSVTKDSIQIGWIQNQLIKIEII